MARILMAGKSKLKNYIQRYELDILEYVLEYLEKLMKLDLGV